MTDKKQVATKKLSLETEKEYGRGKHPNSQSNLQPFEKGKSGNPDGRPSNLEKLKKALIQQADLPYDALWNLSKDPVTWKDAVIDRIWYEASEGNLQLIKLLAETGCLDEQH
mgnify:CR=1 FL=1